MNVPGFDRIVLGAGLAGLSCAAELVLHGERPLLISETKEVGSTFAGIQVGKANRGFTQHLTWQLQSGGGWWYQQARALNIPLRFYPSLSFYATLRGSRKIIDIPMCVSASAVTDVIAECFPPVGAARRLFEKVIEAALAIPYQELMKMRQVPLGAWLEDQGADETVSALMVAFCGNIHELNAEDARNHLSAFGGLAVFRSVLCGEIPYYIAYPDIREGLCIPIAHKIEERGGTVWRGRRVKRVLTDGGQVGGVVLEDGTEVRSPTVAVACGNSRISSLLDPLPPEVEAPLAYSAGYPTDDFFLFTVHDKPIVTRERRFIAVINPEDGSNIQWDLDFTAAAPWTTEPGKQLVGSQCLYRSCEVAKVGGEKAIYAEMQEVNEELYPGYKDSIVEMAAQSHRHHWLTPIMVGPKLPRTIDSVRGLWFVGDGSVPCDGLFMEGAASCGILGAREMLSAHR